MPAVLKNAIDWGNPEWNKKLFYPGKPAAVIGAIGQRDQLQSSATYPGRAHAVGLHVITGIPYLQ